MWVPQMKCHDESYLGEVIKVKGWFDILLDLRTGRRAAVVAVINAMEKLSDEMK